MSVGLQRGGSGGAPGNSVWARLYVGPAVSFSGLCMARQSVETVGIHFAEQGGVADFKQPGSLALVAAG